MTRAAAILAILAALLAGAGAGGFYAGSKAVQAEWDAQRAEDAVAAQEALRLAARANQRISDEQFQAVRDARQRERDAADRLRDLSDAHAAATAACRGGDAPEVARLHPATGGDLVALAREADEAVIALTACQRYVREVVRPQQ